MAFIGGANVHLELVGIFRPSPVPLGFSSGGGAVCCPALTLTRGKAWVFQLLGWAHPLILLTCENMTGLMESSPRLALVALSSAPEAGGGGGGGIDPYTWPPSPWRCIWCVIVRLR